LILLSKLKELLNSLRRSKKNKGEVQRAWQKCDACGELTQYFVVFLYKSSLICHKCYEEDTWLAKIKQKEAITNGGF
jgi:formylmethanofuran dehydrogenase subunit E